MTSIPQGSIPRVIASGRARRISDAHASEGGTGTGLLNGSNDMHQALVTVRGNVAWVTYDWTDAGVVEEKRVTSRGKSTRIFVKENGRWLCIHGHYAAVP